MVLFILAAIGNTDVTNDVRLMRCWLRQTANLGISYMTRVDVFMLVAPVIFYLG